LVTTVSHSPPQRQLGRLPRSAGFTLVEVLVTVAIIGVLVGLLLPAVNSARESARRLSCANNCRQMGLGVLAYEATLGRYPAGRAAYSPDPVASPPGLHGWSSFILEFIEQKAVFSRIDYRSHWNAPGGNETAAATLIPTYVCPSSRTTFPGKQDYAGILGSAVRLSTAPRLPPDWQQGGVLYATSARGATRPATVRMVTDGLSKTLLVTEAVDRLYVPPTQRSSASDSQIGGSQWASGYSCVYLGAKQVNTPGKAGFRGPHPGGIQTLFADGHVAFIADATAADVLVALCTKRGGEATSDAL
jgi:prepilin-type N-terminal cleavage/methylation domain-containing protein/prepilin-type processing-associated H-X9-DG protein